jgi:hypothetical protein
MVKLATAIPVQISLTLLIDPRYEPAAVTMGARVALLDPAGSLLGAAAPIGQTIFNSQIYDACLGVPGTVAVHGLEFRIAQAHANLVTAFYANTYARLAARTSFVASAGEKHFAGTGAFFELTADNLTISYKVAGHD